MMRRILKYAFLSTTATALLCQADVENFIVEKRTVTYQTASFTLETPSNPAFLDFYFEISGAPELESASFSANLSDVPFQFQDDTVWRGFVEFETQTELDFVYNNAYFYDFTTQLAGQSSKTAKGRLAPSGGYPIYQPIVSNFSQVSSVSPNIDFNILMSNSATGVDGSIGSNYVQFTLIDPVSIGAVLVDQYPKTTTRIEIERNQLESSHDYLARVQFVCQSNETTVTGTNDYPVVGLFSRETWFRLRTTGSYQTLVPTLTQYSHWRQDDADNILAESDEDYLLGHVDQPPADNLYAVTLSQLSVRKGYAFETELGDEHHDFEIELRDEDYENFISGLISIGWSYNDGDTQLEMMNWEHANVSTPPQITNWNACQGIVPTTDFNIQVQQPENMPDDIAATIEIRDSEDEVVAEIQSTATADENIYPITIPANTLDVTTPYSVRLTIIGNETVTSGIDARNAHVIEFDIETTLNSWDGVQTAAIYRGAYFDNDTGNSDPNDASIQFVIREDSLNELEQAAVYRPQGAELFALARESSVATVLQEVIYEDANTLGNLYPDDVYWFETTKDGVATQIPFTLEMPDAETPDIHVNIGNLADGIDPSLPLPISWSGFNAAADGMDVEVYIEGAVPQTQLLQSIASDGLSGELPADYLQPNTAYSLRLVFKRNLVVDTESLMDAELITGDAYFTTLAFTTGEAAYADWLSGFLSTEQLADPSFTATSANPDGDALTNLQEFALNGNPISSTPTPGFAAQSTSYSITFNWRSDNPLLSYDVEYSTTLEPPFSAYEGTPTVIEGSPYDQVRITFDRMERLFARLIIHYGLGAE
ncbi:hypothetical protein [Cerasicoccus frondis]|uniref:hypothetical protein n=1 Tax=Cerasicoccus frondis TaxID=490090 RepID=UPI0028525C65|nr:hypothetical protein [Cerasicoccus frondis]